MAQPPHRQRASPGTALALLGASARTLCLLLAVALIAWRALAGVAGEAGRWARVEPGARTRWLGADEPTRLRRALGGAYRVHLTLARFVPPGARLWLVVPERGPADALERRMRDLSALLRTLHYPTMCSVHRGALPEPERLPASLDASTWVLLLHAEGSFELQERFEVVHREQGFSLWRHAAGGA